MIDLFATFLAGIWDWRTKTIPNLITYPLIVYGIYTGVFFPVFIAALFLSTIMYYFDIWHEGDVKLIVGLSLIAPERFFIILIGIWLATIPATIYCYFKKIDRYAYAPFIFIGVLYSYLILI